MTFRDSILEQQAKRLFPSEFVYVPTCDCTGEAEPQECDEGHLICGECAAHMVEARI